MKKRDFINKLILGITILSFLAVINTFTASAAIPSPTKAKPSPAATGTSTSTSSAQQSVGEKLNKQINQLKERIASRVAELNLVEKRGIIGTVTETSGNQITFTDITGKTRFIDVDEISKFASSDSKSTFGLSDLVKGTKISVLGLYNKQSQRILGRFIDTLTTPVYLSGRISEIDRKNFTLTVISEDLKQNKVDVGTSTTISIYTKDDDISKYGFSKLTIGDRVMVTGYPDSKDTDLLVASRILDLSEIPSNPKIIIPEAEEITPSPEVTKALTPSPKVTSKITPTRKISPTGL